MESFSLVILLVVLINTTTALLEPRKVLHIPEKIIGGVIDMVQSHKNKPTQAYQTQSQTQVQGNQQYTAWAPPANQAYQSQSQSQFQGQNQYNNYANYPAVPTGTYPATVSPTIPNQGSYGGSQTQGQFQNFAQQSGNQFQAQNQNYHGQAQNQFQGQQNNFQNQNQVQLQGQNQYGVNQPNYVQGQGQFQNQAQYVGNNQNQLQVQTGQYGHNTGQNYQTSQFNGQSYQPGQFSGQNTQFIGSGSGLGSAQVPFQGLSNVIGQNEGLQTPGSQQPVGSGPTCVCQAWTKHPLNGLDGAGKSEDVTEKSEVKTDS
ncbi:putative uncharacterized protein DDB_G0279653 [Bombyx mori]|uniref:Cuticle protein n=1 Tax=Bombyx mori TaxID=7091 RepID=A0A8R2HR83_BOMMO|nr:putative uncharacterized protein DDB_G0279653 [Bombyx mori]